MVRVSWVRLGFVGLGFAASPLGLTGLGLGLSTAAGSYSRLTRGFLKNSYLAKFFLKYSRLSVSIPQPESTSRTDSWSSIVLSGETRKKE